VSRPRYTLDVTARRSRDGLVVAGGTPARLVRLKPAGRDALDAALSGMPWTSPAARRLIERLVAAGLLHPAGGARSVPDGAVSSVVPVRDGAHWLRPLVGALAPDGEVIVVDDGSRDGSDAIARAEGARVLANRGPPGPSGARNAGLAAARTELVAFVDSDVRPRAGWLAHLVPLFADPRIALAAPRVTSAAGPSPVERYERSSSPLDLGAHPGLVGPGRRLTYLPSAALVARRAALLEVGGFDEDLRIGEDVDLVWRLIKRGWRVRYAPQSVVDHHPRSSLVGLARQRYTYGRSAALLERRHPRCASALQLTPQTAAIWLAGAVLGPVAAAGAFTASTVSASLSTGASGRREVVALAAGGHLRAGRHVARVLVREWLPGTVLACLVSSRARRVALLALAVDGMTSRSAADRLHPLAHVALRALDSAAYSAGVWRGAVGERSLAAVSVGGLGGGIAPGTGR
jgi:mycofactocin system glycosyltransferase